ncbi:hypothetical protein AGOR_G00001240 [Albula goreensis]|uniref:Roc domain-containing protein n=1 Tax=Albula goreensis TaxID=1534307 RepID=A0A8T3E728_9TELE|nr:hypothetical protein AGOR_G00001240 [Albula goreensis]
MFLGSSMAGKSTLCRSLREGQAVGVAVEDRTVGIDISEVERDGVQLLFWDFAGHEEYYLTHHVFITPQALVILTINLASYSIADPTSFKDMVSFWMNNVMMRVPDSVVLPVGTHADQCTESEIQEKEKDIGKNIREMLEERQSKLQSRISNIKDKDDPSPFSEQLNRLYHLADLNIEVLDLLPLDCTKSEEIMKLQEHILKHVQNKELFPNVESTLPRSYQVVESSIRNLMKNRDFPKHGIVGIDDLQKRCSDLEELAREDWQCILRYLHRIGIVMWYEEIEGVRDKVFTKPSFLITLFKTVVRHDLVRCLEDLPQNILQKVNGLGRYRKMWANELKGKSTLRNTAIAALVRRSLMQLDLAREDSFVKEIAGSRQREGELVCLLRHFDICLPIKLSSPLNPQAQEFNPRIKWSPSSAQTLYDPDGGYLFPGYLKDTVTVMKMWGMDQDDDLRVNVYFLPEIPYGVFHRLIIRACLLYSKYWLGKDCFLLGYDTTLVLLRQDSDKNQDEYIQIRCRSPASSADFRRSWDLIVAMIRKLNQLTEQWPGLFQIVCSPCWESGCEEGFEWRDLGKLGGCDIYDAVKEEKLVCSNGHICRSEFLFPKVPSAPNPDTENEATFLNIQAQNVTVSVNQVSAGSP